MKLDTFLKENRIKLNPEIKKFSDDGLEIMKRAKDPLHNLSHIERLFSELNLFLKKSNKKHDINFNILVPAICWHDTWRSKRASKNSIKIIYDFVMDGVGSERLTKKALKKVKIDKKTGKNIRYCIAKHSSVQLRKPRTEESRLLIDIDTVDMWSPERLEIAKEFIKENRGLKRVARITRRLALRKEDKEKYYFPWFKKRHKTVFPKFIKKMEELIWVSKPKKKRFQKLKSLLPFVKMSS
ncbi:hypothetical protein A2716_05270 [candidate division WWE3 bacterium RIFCSPHIGHO2_01_FULL_40_23]|uniref:HD domain-containing protein n=1 Tax=candidate division WWE3 bacterium RIFCSPLOWO2_01_FULL_41_18 TaxID=1802625 RepID=A0A1F4VDN8_UNCKA|nr:MAG: hypothetical protein A2716_05270 [candidate division WWE3 bacterium RIFCSPHIGHO2_01_FULL_40_23]OGC55279.1 MAG: hypothetical protein A3A78_04880 [candidate division WWE3 bacterium RIFCSPLOWO2_01_FULL_41_18]